jgi:predicted ABC-type sugar transport system permease subunit
MTGVEILATEEVVIATAFNWVAFCLSICFFLGVAGIVSVFVLYNPDTETVVLSLALGLVFGVLIGALCAINSASPTEYETQYKVTISDEVSMNEFLEHYEIIDQEGKIFTVREKE